TASCRTASAARLATVRQRLTLARPGTDTAGRRVDQLGTRLTHAWQTQWSRRTSALTRLGDSLGHLNPQAVLGRGYAVVRDENGHIVRRAGGMEPSETIRVYLAHGRLDATIHTVDTDDQLIPAKPGGNV
ncbi:MAG: exodeoxyribonuclease large subunit, partial [Pseudomonadota bacterium]|nr:exodeoxyribonuclease large subunit [Pseudomonadota bacterium]